jgi:hypothetical protein
MKTVVPRCEDLLVQVIASATSTGEAEVKRYLANRQRLYDEAVSATKTDAEIAEMIIVFANLISTTAAVKELLGRFS